MAVSVVAVLLLLELAIRQFGPFLPGTYRTGPLIELDPELGWHHVPSSTTWYRAREFTSRIDINAEGRVGPPLRERRDGPRVLILGDSFAEAAQVRYEEGIGGRLSALLQGVPAEIVNGAVSGYGTDQQLLLLERELGALRPDAVVLVFSISTDVWDNHVPFSAARPTKAKPYFELGPGGEPVLVRPPFADDLLERIRGLLARSTALTVLKSGIADRIFDRDAAGVRRRQLDVLVPARDEWGNAWRITEALLGRVAALARDARVPVVLVLTPDGCQVYRRACGDRTELTSSDVPQSRLRAFAATAGMGVADPLDALRAGAARGEAVYFAEDLHWTSRGHEIVAEVVARWLRQVLGRAP